MKIILALLTTILVTNFCFGQEKTNADSISKNKYYNPIENKVYVAEDGFKTYKDGKEVDSIQKNTKKETKFETIILLSGDQELKESTSVEDLKIIVDKTNEIFYKLFNNSKKTGQIMIQFELQKEKDNIIQFAVRDDLDLEIMKKFEKLILAEKFPKSHKNPIKFQLIYKVNSKDN